MKNGSVVLDVGCGFGRNIRAIARKAKSVIGVDNDRKLIQKIKKGLSKFSNVKIFLGDAGRIHLPGNTFDYAICMGNTLGDFYRGKLEILREMKRVTRNGGKIVVSVYSEKAFDARLAMYKRIGLKILKTINGTVYTKDGLVLEQFDKGKIRSIFKSAKLDVKIIELNPVSYLCEAAVKK